MIKRVFESDVIYQLDAWLNGFSTLFNFASCDMEILYSPTRVKITNVKSFVDGYFYLDDATYEMNIQNSSSNDLFYSITEEDNNYFGNVVWGIALDKPNLLLCPRNIPKIKRVTYNTSVEGTNIDIGFHPFFLRYYNCRVNCFGNSTSERPMAVNLEMRHSYDLLSSGFSCEMHSSSYATSIIGYIRYSWQLNQTTNNITYTNSYYTQLDVNINDNTITRARCYQIYMSQLWFERKY